EIQGTVAVGVPIEAVPACQDGRADGLLEFSGRKDVEGDERLVSRQGSVAHGPCRARSVNEVKRPAAQRSHDRGSSRVPRRRADGDQVVGVVEEPCPFRVRVQDEPTPVVQEERQSERRSFSCRMSSTRKPLYESRREGERQNGNSARDERERT